MYGILLCIGILCSIILLYYLYLRPKKCNVYKQSKESISGLFINIDEHEGSRIYPDPKNSAVFYRHKQGLSSYLDEKWIQEDQSNVYLINQDDSRRVVFENDIIFVYEKNKLIEKLHRNKELCFYGETEEPTYENFNRLYDLVEVNFDQTELLAELLSYKKACATINDIHIHTGKRSNIYMSRGMFAMDKKRKCFYYISRDNLPLIISNVENIKTLVIDVEEFREAVFVGAMS
jgi:hypothetical protein